MHSLAQASFLALVLFISAGFTIGLTYAPCYATVCSEKIWPLETRIHIAVYYGLLASIGCALFLRAYKPSCRRLSSYYLLRHEVPVLEKRVSVGGLALAIWIVSVTLATTAFWVPPVTAFYALRSDPLGWADGQVRLVVTQVTGHHADILLGLLLIPVSRNSLLGRFFKLHQSTLLYAHKLVAYLLVVSVLAHGVAYYYETFVGSWSAQDLAAEFAFNVDNPTMTFVETEQVGAWYSATLPVGMLSFIIMLVIVITALPVLRRCSYNTFYYAHIICSACVFITASFHASTNFYFLLPGLVLWALDWAWRLFGGDTGLGKHVDGTLANAGGGWYRITLPASARALQDETSLSESVEDVATEKQALGHPLQTYYINIPSISKLQNHAFTAAKIRTNASGPVLLFQPTPGSGKMKQKRLAKEWTQKLASVDSRAGMSENGTRLGIRVEGPYIPPTTGFQTADRVVCVVGGTGLTGAYSLALWWLECRSREPKAYFTLVWSIRQRESACLEEWQQLEDRVAGVQNMSSRVHVSSEDGRLDIAKALRGELAAADGVEKVSSSHAWIYASGPVGLLRAAEDACVDLERELRGARKAGASSRFAVRSAEHYVAKWEV